MKRDIILAGVGGQGVLSVGVIISSAAVEEGLEVRQSEVHGMAQRGGAVQAHLRISDRAIASDLVPKGAADLILAMEPLEALRYINWLSPRLESGEPGALVSAAEPLINIPNYPDTAAIIELLKSFPLHRIVQAAELAKEAGLAQSVNMVMVGAASPFLPIRTETLEATIEKMFSKRGAGTVKANIKAFALGKNAV
jgi:indolepyruvate ferredoxin oxidoreductase beta subunit